MGRGFGALEGLLYPEVVRMNVVIVFAIFFVLYQKPPHCPVPVFCKMLFGLCPFCLPWAGAGAGVCLSIGILRFYLSFYPF